MEKYYPYPCECCGGCCLHVDLIEEMKVFDRGDGVCKNLTEKNLCKIYANRPKFCDGKYFYENFFSDMTVTEFHNMMKSLCKKIKEREHLI
ncbi:MAG: hypothetical protein IJU91_06195 [Selenomonadaceae bacterium]|nr:hypothetical protein [Selenomonadaceae bacterium]